MLCPCCGKNDKVFILDSRIVKRDGSMRRRRECRRCKLRWTTKEVIVSEPERLKEDRPISDGPHCHRCQQWQERTASCGLGFPEARFGGVFAAECLHYQEESLLALAA